MNAPATQALPELRDIHPAARRFGARPQMVLARAMVERHPDLADHGDRVAALSVQVGRSLGLAPRQLARLRLAAQLHDVGKVAVPQQILDKPDKLDAAEWRCVCRHPEVGAQLLVSANLDDIAEIVVAHHERPDGSGYPYRVGAPDIPAEALIIAAADAFDAMVSARPYRSALPVETAIAEIRRGAGKQFDETVAQTLIDTRALAPA